MSIETRTMTFGDNEPLYSIFKSRGDMYHRHKIRLEMTLESNQEDFEILKRIVQMYVDRMFDGTTLVPAGHPHIQPFRSIDNANKLGIRVVYPVTQEYQRVPLVLIGTAPDFGIAWFHYDISQTASLFKEITKCSVTIEIVERDPD